MAERDIYVSHTTILRGVHRYIPEFERCAMHMRMKCLYCPDRWSLYFCARLRLPAVGDKLDAWYVGATSATDASMLAFTGVARKAWVSPACGPLSTVPIPTI